METRGSIHKENIFECGICLGTVVDPKILPCFHTFCLQCLHTLIGSNGSRGSIKCPMCMKETNVPENGARGFQNNFYIRTQMKDKEVTVCETCEKDTVVFECGECSQIYCSTCADIHMKTTSTRDHHLIEFTGQGTKPIKKEFCEKHIREELVYYCIECEEATCAKCNMTKHKHHTSEDVNDVASSKREQLERDLQSARDSGASWKLHWRIERNQRFRKKILEERGVVRSKMLNHAQEIKDRVDKCVQKMVKDMESKIDVEVKRLDRVLSDLDNKKSKREIEIKTCTQMIESMHDVEFLRIHNDAVRRVEALKIVSEGDIDSSITLEYKVQDVDDNIVQNLCGTMKEGERKAGTTIAMDGCISGILALTESKALVGDCSRLKKVNEDGNIEKVIDVREQIFDVDKDDSGHVYVASESSLFELQSDDSVQKCFDLPCATDGMTTTDDGFVVCSKMEGKVLKIDTSGKIMWEVSLPGEPRKVARGPGGCIYVCGWDTDANMTVLTRDGKIQKVVPCNKKDLYSVSVDCTGPVFVADHNNHVYLYDKDGQYEETILSGTKRDAWSLSVSPNHDVWVGCAGYVCLY